MALRARIAIAGLLTFFDKSCQILWRDDTLIADSVIVSGSAMVLT